VEGKGNMNDLGKQICRCIVGACDDTCRHYDAEKSCCVGYEEVVQQAEKVFSEYEGYKDLEEQNRLIKLPCAVGDTVHHLCTFKNGESEIIEMKVECVEPCGAIRQHKGVCEIWNVYAETDYTKAYFKFFDFGKTVFLTKEEAEAALKELERGKGE